MQTYIKILPLLILSSFLLGASGNRKVKELESKNAQLQARKVSQDSLLNDFMSTFDEFEQNLEAIKTKENLISLSSSPSGSEMRVSQKDKIVEDIQMINSLLDQNRMMIDELNAKAEKFEGQTESYRKMVGSLKKQLKDREAQIIELKDQLASLNFKVDDLNGKVNKLGEVNESLVQLTSDQATQLAQQEVEINTQSETIAAQLTAMNTAYYVAGDIKTLKEAKIVVKGKSLNKDMAESAFTRIDVRTTLEIAVGSKKPILLSSHPEGSYIFTDEDQDKVVDYLQITDPEKF